MKCLLLLIGFLSISSGNSEGNRRIFGGRTALITEYPYQVQIVRVPEKNAARAIPFSSCGGTIVGSNVVLTAGHCTRKGNHRAKNYFVRAGTSYRNGYGGSKHQIIKIITHEKYLVTRRVHSHDDISVIYVYPPFTFDATRQKIPIALTSPTDGSMGRATGWGFIDPHKNTRASELQTTKLKILTRDICNRYSSWRGMIEHNNFCAGGAGDKSTCKGDSGGPLAYDGKLVGMVSWGVKNCVKRGYPAVFTNVTAYIPWIKAKTADSDLTYA